MPISADQLNAGLDRAAAVMESALMMDEVEVFTRADGTFDTSTGTWTDGAETLLYKGKAQIRISQARPVKTLDIGESLNVIREWNLKVPRGTASFPVGAIVRYVDARRAKENIGQLYRIDDWPESTLTATPLYKITQYHPREHEIP